MMMGLYIYFYTKVRKKSGESIKCEKTQKLTAKLCTRKFCNLLRLALLLSTRFMLRGSLKTGHMKNQSHQHRFPYYNRYLRISVKFFRNCIDLLDSLRKWHANMVDILKLNWERKSNALFGFSISNFVTVLLLSIAKKTVYRKILIFIHTYL